MPSVTLKTKEFKKMLKVFAKFSALNIQSKWSTIAIEVEESGKARFVLDTDRALVSANPDVVSSEVGVPYFFNPDTLGKMTMYGDLVTLSWESAASPLAVTDKRFSANLNVAVPRPDYRNIPTDYTLFTIPTPVITAVSSYLNIPYAYFKSKKELTPIHFRSTAEGKLTISADDGFSLARLDTNVDVPPIDFKVAKYIIDSLFFGDITGDEVKLGVKDFCIFLSNGETCVVTSGMNDQTSEFDQVYGSLGQWSTSCKFNPKDLVTYIEPLTSVIPQKDASGSIIHLAMRPERAQMSMKHKDIGELQSDDVKSMTEIFNENSVKNIVINMHPQAFHDYTGMLKVDTAKMYANMRVVYYEAMASEAIKVRYLFPTVQV